MIKFSKEELHAIREATARAESSTSGEIASAVIGESSDYAFQELVFSLFAGVLFFLTLIFFHSRVGELLEHYFWTTIGWQITAFYGLSTFIVIGLFYLAVNIPGVDRFIISSRIINKAVHRRALVHFMESGVYNTRDRTGILIFISLREHRVVLLADEGINSRIEQTAWDSIVTELIDSIRGKKSVQGLVSALESCGKLLSQHFPIKSDDTNELPDGLVFLEE